MKKTLLLITVCGLILTAFGEIPFVWKSQYAGNTLDIQVTVKKDHYFYRSTLVFDVENARKKVLYPVTFPKGEIIADDIFGNVEVYPAGTWTWRFKSDGPIVKASVNFQGCRKSAPGSPGMCFMPETVELLPGNTPLDHLEQKEALLPISLDGFVFERKLTGLHDAPAFSAWLDGRSAVSENAGPLAQAGFWVLAGLALLGGLGLNLTPCVLPMLPITLAIIGAGSSSGRRGLLRGTLYGAGMAAAYGILGLAVVLAGARFGELQSSMYFNLGAAVIFVLLGLAMLGVFNLDFSAASAKLRPQQLAVGKEITAFLMGGVSALLAGACVAPVAVSVLLLASARYQSDGAAALLLPFLLGVGMALPWPLAGAGLAVLPRPGKFMLTVKYIFAALIFAVALWYAHTAWQLRPGVWDAGKEMRQLDTALALAAEKKQNVIIDFQASWCKNCHAMEKILRQQEIDRKLQKFTLIRFRAENLSDPRISALLKKWNIPGLPAFVMLKYAAAPGK